jgi:hypothetical protein
MVPEGHKQIGNRIKQRLLIVQIKILTRSLKHLKINSNLKTISTITQDNTCTETFCLTILKTFTDVSVGLLPKQNLKTVTNVQPLTLLTATMNMKSKYTLKYTTP